MDENEILLMILLISILIEYMDASIGMGYGTAMTPILLLAGFSQIQIVPAVLVSQFMTCIISSILHHRSGNVNFDFNCDYEHKIKKRFTKLGYIPKSLASKIVIILIISSTFGIFTSTLISRIISDFYFKLYIGTLVIVIGLIIITRYKTRSEFSWKKILGLGIVASFNKGLSGGGYGPIIVSGQILSGVEPKSSVGISLLAKGVTSFLGLIGYFVLGVQIDQKLAIFLVLSSIISIPVSTYTVKMVKEKVFIRFIGMMTIFLGMLTIIKCFI